MMVQLDVWADIDLYETDFHRLTFMDRVPFLVQRVHERYLLFSGLLSQRLHIPRFASLNSSFAGFQPIRKTRCRII